MHKIVFALDSFKGSLTSQQANAACAAAARSIFPGCLTVEIAVADGGEGTVEALAAANNCSWHSCRTCDPLGRPVSTRYAVDAASTTAFIAVADASGLPLLSPDELNPMLASSYGTGLEIRHAIENGCRNIVLGVGGSATVDGGIGLLQALGFRFTDSSGADLGRGGRILEHIHACDASAVPQAVAQARITVLCDVDAPLCGPRGAARIFGPQKGATPQMVEQLDRGLANLAAVLGSDLADCPGAGAAGGIAAALKACLGARLVPGAQAVLEMVGFESLVADADLLVTGEGRIDATTLGGKLPYAAMKAAARHGVPAIALAGHVADREKLLAAGFGSVLQITPEGMPLADAMRPETAAANLAEAIKRTKPAHIHCISANFL